MTRVFRREKAFLSSLVMMVSTVYNGVCWRRTLETHSPFGVEACPAVGSRYTLAGIPPLPRYPAAYGRPGERLQTGSQSSC